jgi:hypothetical protein
MMSNKMNALRNHHEREFLATDIMHARRPRSKQEARLRVKDQARKE